MKCADLMSLEFEWIPGSANVVAAAGVMRDRSLGFLLVGEPIPGHPIGFVTDRDLAIRVIAEGLNSAETSVGSIATIGAVACNQDDPIEVAEDKMADDQKSRLAVIDKDGKVVGVLSLTDILRGASPRGAVRTANTVLQSEASGPRWQDIHLTASTPEDEDRAVHQDTVLTGGQHRGAGSDPKAFGS
jgi:signal-transduction protein with cAMP-binding, CBS, and nucleotidyltransferase domain